MSADGKRVILVVDDEADLTQTCERLLRRGRHQVVTAGSCATALAALRGVRPTLLVCDLSLPDGTGLEIVRAAGRLEPPVPAIVMTAQLSEWTRRAALEAGACACIAKPFTTAAFSQMVEGAVAPPDGRCTPCVKA